MLSISKKSSQFFILGFAVGGIIGILHFWIYYTLVGQYSVRQPEEYMAVFLVIFPVEVFLGGLFGGAGALVFGKLPGLIKLNWFFAILGAVVVPILALLTLEQLIQIRQTYYEQSKRIEEFNMAVNWDGQTSMRGYDLSERDLSGLDFSNADFDGAKLISTDLSRANLSGINFSDADLTEANLTGADLGKANHAAYLFRANLTGVHLSGAYMYNARLTRANLSGANLSKADLTEAFFYESNLTDSNLSGANLRKARLSKANLSDANLSNADLTEADLSEAKYTEGTIWPSHFDPIAAGAILLDDGIPWLDQE